MDHSTRAICCTSEAIHSAQNLGTEVKAPMDSPAPKESPFPLPQPTFLQNGWLVDAHGRIFARSLSAHELPDQAYIPGMSADDPRTAMVSFYEGPPSLSAPYSIEPYHQGRAYYYHRWIEVVFIPSWAQAPLPLAVEGMARFWQEPYPEDGFPKGARRYYHFFVHPTPPPILSPLPLHVEPRTVEGWDSIPLKVIRVSYWRDEDRWAIADPMPSLPNTVWAAGGQYPPGAEAYVALNPSTPKIPPAAPLAPLPPITAPLTLLRCLPEPLRPAILSGMQRIRVALNPGPHITKEPNIMAHPIDWRRRNIKNVFMGSIGQRGMSDLDRPMGLKGMTVLGGSSFRVPIPPGIVPGWNQDSRGGSPSSGKSSGHSRDESEDGGSDSRAPKTTMTDPSQQQAGAVITHMRRGCPAVGKKQRDATGQYHPKWANNNPSCFKGEGGPVVRAVL
ncbi:hypothetical protein BS47DRAFT_1369881 [Hydnum rufescens UP504]|uniref:Uncharacterized protein n=1 Tax=Hydnum rufescens UP504 TaxID=1448309 RepID=A0A9P6ADJ7_9AGAM|nr:hypothetical protein BS47DRAFT_1369881 [Hydnum rufescens UP504]